MENIKEIYDKVTATKRATTCIEALVNEMINEDIIDDDEEDILIKKHNIMTSLLKCADAFKPMGLDAPEARGAIAEMMCMYLINRWLETRKIQGIAINGLLLDVYPSTPNRDDTTELDIVLVTETMICIIECKSFRGNKVTDGSIISTKNIAKQPWNQNHGHVIAFKNNAKKFLNGVKMPRIYNIVYMFAEGKFTEWRQPSEPGRYLLVNLGAMCLLDQLNEDSTADGVVLSKSDLDKITQFLRNKEPSVEEQAEHVARLKKLI